MAAYLYDDILKANCGQLVGKLTPGDDTAMKLLYLVLNKAVDEWKRPPREWSEAKTQFAVIFGERFVI
jgi:transposase-like protein